MSKSSPCMQGGVPLSQALERMSLTYNPITKKLHLTDQDESDTTLVDSFEPGHHSKKGSFSDEGISLSPCEKSDTSDSPKSTLSGHKRSKESGSFSSTISSWSEYSLAESTASKDDEEKGTAVKEKGKSSSKLKKKGLASFFTGGAFPWRNSYSTSKEDHQATQEDCKGTHWKLFTSKSSGNLSSLQSTDTPVSSGCTTPSNHKRQGSTTSEKQFDDLIASSIALIQHERPSHLPAKCSEEASRHRLEHARMVENARRMAQRDVAVRKAKIAQERNREDALAKAAREWTTDILPIWSESKSSKYTQELWWSGLPPSVRGKIWQLSIENQLQITPFLYRECAKIAKEKLNEARNRRCLLKMLAKKSEKNSSCASSCMTRNLSEQNLKSGCLEEMSQSANSKSNPNLADYGDECSMELIEMDISRTFPHLCIFQPGGPYFDILHELLGAYACFRPNIGYVQGMSFIAAVLILNMEVEQAFICFANLLEGPVLKAAFSRDGATMQRYWSAYERLLEENIPQLKGRLAPELYLVEWIYTAFAKAMSLDACCRVWDLIVRDGDGFLFRTALGILHMYQDELIHMDFIAASQFLTKLPEDMNIDLLFKSIAHLVDTIDGKDVHQMAQETNL